MRNSSDEDHGRTISPRHTAYLFVLDSTTRRRRSPKSIGSHLLSMSINEDRFPDVIVKSNQESGAASRLDQYSDQTVIQNKKKDSQPVQLWQEVGNQIGKEVSSTRQEEKAVVFHHETSMVGKSSHISNT